jgi:hypothetical protein
MKTLQLRTQYALYRRFFKPELFWAGQACFHFLSRLGLFVGSSSFSELNGQEPVDLCWKMSEFQKSAGRARLDGLAVNACRRRRLAAYYANALSGQGWQIPSTLSTAEVTLVRFPLLVRERDDCCESLAPAASARDLVRNALHPCAGGTTATVTE